MFNSELLKKLSTGVLLFCVVLACKSTQSHDTPTVLTSQDGKFQLTLPEGWSKSTQLNDKADIQASNKPKVMFALVLIESEEDLAKGMTLEKYTEITQKSLMSKYDSPEASAPESMSINGNDAQQYELKGSKDATALDLLVTTVKTPNHYSQIIAWTVPSKMSENKPALKQVTESFREASK